MLASFRKKVSTKFKNRYRIILRKDENLEEKISFVLTPWNLLLVLSGGLLLFGTIIYLLLAYTPLNYIFPTKSSKYSNIEQYKMIQKIDSLESSLTQLRLQSDVLSKVLAGEDVSMDIDEIIEEIEPEKVEVNTSSSATENKVVMRRAENNTANYNFFVPLKGAMSDTFNQDRKHMAVDIAAKSKSVIKSIQKGTVIFSAWTPGGGHTMVVQHHNDFISVYKHNAVLLKKEGTFVNAGDAIALVGSTGELTSGPHLHFELWKNGIAVNPVRYINF